MSFNLYTDFYIDAAWTDYSSYVRGEQGIIITRGLGDQQSSLAAQTSSFTLNNRNGLFSNRNPMSPLYRKIPQNTPVRHRLGALDSHLKVRHPINTAYAETADKAALDIVSDIDIRIELTPDTWRPDLDLYLCGKWQNASRSWYMRLNVGGTLTFGWSTDGVSSISGTTGVSMPINSGRIAIRFTYDVVDGANKTRTWYTGPSIAGPWTQLEAPATTAGNTSFFASTASLQIGAANSGAAFTGGTNGYGKYHAFELYNGIAGSQVASLAVTSLSPGTTSWSDAFGNTWATVGDNARIGSDVHRFTGETTSLPSKWDVTGTDVYVPVTAAGVLRRLSQRSSALHSAIYRNFVQFSSTNTLHAPMEENSGSTILSNVSPLPNKSVNRIIDVTFSGTSPSGLPGSNGSLTFNSAPGSQVIMRASALASTGAQTFIIYFKLSALPAADSKLISMTSTGTGVTWTVSIGATGFAFNILDRDGVSLSSASVLYGTGGSPLNQWLGISLRGVQEGANVRWKNVWHVVGTDGFFTSIPAGLTYVGTAGRFTSMSLLSTDAAFLGAEFSQALISQLDLDISSTYFQESSNAFIGETAGNRAIRLADEESLRLDMYGNPDNSEAMGPQNADTLANILEECVIADAGMMCELRDALGFGYYTRQFMENKYPTSITYTDSTLAETPEPVEDDRYILNDVTVVRPTGGYERFEVTSGALSTQQPPNGVGRYDATLPVNVAADSQLLDQASYRAFQGTWDEARVPGLTFGLHRSELLTNTTLTERLMAADIATWVRLTDMPSFVPPDDLDLIITGTLEELYKHIVRFSYSTIPGGPYRVPVVDDADNPVRFDAENSTLDLAIATTTFGSLQVTNNGDAADTWAPTATFPSEVPFDVIVNGEVMTVTNVGNIFSTTKQTLTVTRSVNGVTKTHAIGSQVRLARPSYFTL